VILFVALVVSLLTTPLRALLPVLVVDVLDRDAQSLGLLVSAAGAGALAGSLAIASFGRKGRGLMFLMAGVASGLALLVVAMLTSYAAAVAVLAVFGLGEAGQRVLTQALIMEHAEDRFRGRLMSVNEMRLGIAFLGVIPAGMAADNYGIEGTLVVLGIAAIAASVLALATQGWLRRLK
jgi:MFS family permease